MQVRQFIIYGIVGGASALSVAGGYLLLCQLGIVPVIATIISNCLGMVIAYIGHTRFTFQKTHYFAHKEFIKFIIASLIGLLSNFLWVFILVHVLGFKPIVGVYPMIFFTPIITFVISKFWAFR